MANCTNVGSQGTNVPLPDLVNTTSTPLNCFLSGFTQTGNLMTCTINQTSGEVTTQVASISGGGQGGALLSMTTTSFPLTSGNTYSAVITSTGSQTPQIITDYNTLAYGTTNYVGGYMLCAEDTPSNGDCDFNDAVVNITWTLYAG